MDAVPFPLTLVRLVKYCAQLLAKNVNNRPTRDELRRGIFIHAGFGMYRHH
jgi:hypothetical protein